MTKFALLALLCLAVVAAWPPAGAAQSAAPESSPEPAAGGRAADAGPEPSAAPPVSPPSSGSPAPSGTGASAAPAIDNAEQAAEQFYGATVSAVQLEIPKYMERGPIARAVTVKAGAVLQRWRVRQTMRNLYLVGDVENAIVFCEPDDGKVKVTVRIYPQYVIRDIAVFGSTAYSTTEILSDILRVESGDDFVPESLADYKEKLTDAFANAGYFQAAIAITATQTKREDDNKADVTIRVHEGAAFHVADFDFTGADLGVTTKAEILKIAHWKPGMQFNQDKIQSGLKRIKSWLKDNRFLEALVPDIDIKDPTTVRIDQDRHTIAVVFPLQIGPRIDIFYESSCFTCAEKKWKFPEVVGLENQKRFTEWITADFAKRIVTYYQREGYYAVKVNQTFREYVEQPAGQAVKAINFTAEKGPVVAIRRIHFHDNRRFNNNVLVKLLTNRDDYVEEDFNKDLQNVINFYNTNGYLKARIVQKTVVYDEPAAKIDVDVVIEEGPQTIVRSLVIQNAHALSDRHFITNFPKKLTEYPEVGKPFNPFLIQPTKTFILSEYFKSGYAKARIHDRQDFSDDNTAVDLIFDNREGIKYRIGNIFIRGNKLTKKNIIERELVIVPGQPYNFEKIFRSEQALIQLGIFTSVNIAPVNAELDAPDVDMMVTVEERKSGYIKTQVGYNTFVGYDGAFEIGHRNLAGYDRQLSFRLEATVIHEDFDLDTYNVAVAFGWPWVARVPLDATFTISDAQRHEIAYDDRALTVDITGTVPWKKLFNFLETNAHSDKTREMAARNHDTADPFTTELIYELSEDYIYNISAAVTDQPQGRVVLSTISPMIIFDLRDNVFNPTRWTYNSVRLDYGTRFIFSNIDYLKITGRTSWYLPIYQALKFLPGWVFAENVVVSQLQSLHRGDVVPISHRLFLGGSTTLRGFGQNEISPLASDNRTPVGGYFMAYQNTELRIPLGVYDLGLLAFFDAGDVTGNITQFDYLRARAASGVGFEYLSPVGPISADVGFNLNKRSYESLYQFYITIGNAF